MIRTIETTSALRRDFKREQKIAHSRKFNLDRALQDIIDLLAAGKPLASRHWDHSMAGDWTDHRSCHIRPDLVLLYRLVENPAASDQRSS